MKLKEIINEIERIAPLSLQEEWDNCGFQIKLHRDDDEISNIYLCLEITSETINDALENKAQLIITHHPLFFGSFNEITIDTYNGKFIKELIKNNISVYSSHTAFDICDGGNNDFFGKLLGAKNINKIETDPDEICRYGDFDKRFTLEDFINLLSCKFNISKTFFNYAGPKNLLVQRAAWVTGAGADYIIYAKDVDADIFVTGDLSYHKARDAKELNMPTLAIGHYASEIIFIKNMFDILNSKFNTKINIIQSKMDNNPFNEI